VFRYRLTGEWMCITKVGGCDFGSGGAVRVNWVNIKEKRVCDALPRSLSTRTPRSNNGKT